MLRLVMRLGKRHTKVSSSLTVEFKEENKELLDKPQESIEIKKEYEGSRTGQNTYSNTSTLSGEELKRKLYPHMFTTQNGAVDKSNDKVKERGSFNNKEVYQRIDNIVEDGSMNADMSFTNQEPAEESVENYEDKMIHSRRELMPHEYRFLSETDRVRLTNSRNNGAIYLFNIPSSRNQLHGFALYVFDGQVWRLIPYRNVSVNAYENISNQLRTLGYMVGGQLDEGFQNWSFGRITPISHHNISSETVDAAQINITDRILPGNLFKLVDTGSGTLREYNFEYIRGASNNRNNGIDIPIDFNSFESIPEFSQISRYAGARGLAQSNSSKFLLGTILGFGIGYLVMKR